ncbi:MAG: holo-ACP synthase [bacterium]|jgi:holo-[acyl-carrier protein] synthase
MIIKGVGIDIIEVERISRAVSRYPEGFQRRVFTSREWEYCCRGGEINYPSLAARFAGKEAVLKALGCGWPEIPWQEIEILKEEEDPPAVHLGLLARAKAREKGIISVLISLSHTKSYAVAQALAQGEE